MIELDSVTRKKIYFFSKDIEKTKCNIYPDIRVIFTWNKSYLHLGKIYPKLGVMVFLSTYFIFFFSQGEKINFTPTFEYITRIKNYSSVFSVEIFEWNNNFIKYYY